MCTCYAGARRRTAFTLIELLVVMTLIILLATLAVLVAPRFSERQKTSMGAGQVQGWLFNAKQRAYRDKMIRGVRFLPFTTSQTPVGGAGLATVQPADPPGMPAGSGMNGIHAGSVIAVDVNQNPELVTVLAILPGPPPQFTATFTKAHAVGFSITPGRATDLEYTEQPDNFTAGYISGSVDNPSATPPSSTLTITFPAGTSIDLTQIVGPGDILFLRGGTEAHLVLNVPTPQPNTNPPTGTITVTQLLSPIPPPPPPSQVDYWIARGPRPLASEPILSLPQDIVVDFFPNTSPQRPVAQWAAGQLAPPYVYDVLFTPTGPVQQRGAAPMGKYVYWVRDASLDTPFQGEPTLISVYTNTGGIAAHPVSADDAGAVLNGSYYFFTQDGRSSGM
jgi:hypothetical protein